MKTIHLQAIQCPNCGAPARVAPESSSYACGYCQAAFAVVQGEPPTAPAPRAIPAHATPGAPVQATSGKIVLAFITVSLCGAGVIAAVIAGAVGPRRGAWSGREPLLCSGNDVIFVKDLKAKLGASPAVVARDNCLLFLTDVTVEAPVVVRATENGQVMFDHGAALGGAAWSDTSDNGSVTTNHTRTAGAQRSAPSKPPPTGGTTGDPIVCKANERLEIRGVTVRRTSGAAVIVNGNCRVELFDCKLEAPVGVVVGGNGDVKLHNCDIRATNGVYGAANAEIFMERGSLVAKNKAVDVRDNAGFESSHARVEGEKGKTGNGKLRGDP
jgi:hypothetical protein